MALFTDGPMNTIEDLRAQDSQLTEMASTEGIDLTRKLWLAHDQIAVDLERLLAGRYPLSNVVATLPLTLWHNYRSLEMAYTDACYSHLNERYMSKRDQFRDLAKWAYERLLELGIGIVALPIARALTPVLSPVPGFSHPGTYYVTMTWVNRSGEEGAPAVPDVIEIASGSISVMPKSAPPAATGWNVYVGPGPDDMVLQNEAPLEVNETWSPHGAVKHEGRGPGKGQPAGLLLAVPRVLPRG
jgi:hypothetical protein